MRRRSRLRPWSALALSVLPVLAVLALLTPVPLATGAVARSSDTYWADQWALRGLPDEPAGTQIDAAWDDDWRLAAQEGERAFVAGPAERLVRYGRDYRGWRYQEVRGDVTCDTTEFGGDPAFGSRKHCDVAETWAHVAHEEQSYVLPSAGSHWVRYGWGEAWRYKLEPGPTGDCSSAAFGGDPWRYQRKICQVQDRQDGFGVVATEGMPFSTAGKATAYAVRFGAIDMWTYTRVDPQTTYVCDVRTFGDPRSGQANRCELVPTMGAGVTVAVADQGLVPHRDLDANVVPGLNLVDGALDRDTTDYGGAPCRGVDATPMHGLLTAGVIGAVIGNGRGIAGAAPLAQVQPVKLLNCRRTFSYELLTDAWSWASGRRLDGAPPNTTPARVVLAATIPKRDVLRCEPVLKTTLDQLRADKVLLVAAAGNESRDLDQRPADLSVCDNVVLVGNVNRSGERAGTSDFGRSVDISAPGDGGMTLNHGTGDAYSPSDGTTGASARVAAVAVLMLGVNPVLSAANLETRLKLTARPFPRPCDRCGAGIVDAAAAVRSARALTTKTATNSSVPDTITAPADVRSTFDSGVDTDGYRVYLPPGRTLTATFDAPRPGNKSWSMSWPADFIEVPGTQRSLSHTNTTAKTEVVVITTESLAPDSDMTYTLTVDW